MSKLSIEKKITIDAPVDKAFEIIANFQTWKHWSPWLICEPGAEVKINDKGDFYSWNGKRVGSGQMKMLKKAENKIDYDLTFLKPWKSQADVSFTVKEENGQTVATWSMDSKLPFFMFFMKKKMEAFIGMDYERGLKMLKEYVETGQVCSKLDFVGEQMFDGSTFIGIKTHTTMDLMGEQMKKNFGTMSVYAKENGVEMSGLPFTQYHKFDFVTRQVEYTAAFPVKEKPSNLPNNIFFGKLEKFQMHVVRHIGKYDHIGNAWATQAIMSRNKEFKQSKKLHPFELYHNSPMDTPVEELKADICFPLK